MTTTSTILTRTLAAVAATAALSATAVATAPGASADEPTRYYSETVTGGSQGVCESNAATRVAQLQSEGWYVTFLGCAFDRSTFTYSGTIGYS